MYSDIFLFHHPKIGIGKNELFILFILKNLGNTEIGKLRPHKRHDENPWEPARVGRTKHLYNNTFAPRCGAYLSFGTYSRLFTLERCYNITAPYFFFLLFAERGAPVSLEGNNQQSFMRKGSAPKFLAFYVPFLTEQISFTHTLLKWYLFCMIYIHVLCILKNRVSIRYVNKRYCKTGYRASQVPKVPLLEMFYRKVILLEMF